MADDDATKPSTDQDSPSAFDMGTEAGRNAQFGAQGARADGSQAGVDTGEGSSEEQSEKEDKKKKKARDTYLAVSEAVAEAIEQMDAAIAKANDNLGKLKAKQQKNDQALDAARTRETEIDQQMVEAENQHKETSEALDGAKSAQIDLQTDLESRQETLASLKENMDQSEKNADIVTGAVNNAKLDYATVDYDPYTGDFTPQYEQTPLPSHKMGMDQLGSQDPSPDFVGQSSTQRNLDQQRLVYQDENGEYRVVTQFGALGEATGTVSITDTAIEDPKIIEDIEKSGKPVLSEAKAREILQAKIDAQVAQSTAYAEYYNELFGIEDLEEAITASEETIDSLKKQLGEIETELTTLRESKTATQEEIAALEKRGEKIDDLITRTNDQIRDMENFKLQASSGEIKAKDEEALLAQKDKLAKDQESLDAEIAAVLSAPAIVAAPKPDAPAKAAADTAKKELTAEEKQELLIQNVIEGLMESPVLGLLAFLFASQHKGGFLEFFEQFTDGKVNLAELLKGNDMGDAAKQVLGSLDRGRLNKHVEGKLPEGPGIATTDNDILALIRRHESAENYNIANGSRAVDFTSMTVNDVIAWQQQDERTNGNMSAAAGAYQIIRTTLTGLRDSMGLTGNEKFDEAMQDRMATKLMEQRGYRKFLSGEISGKEFMHELSREWAAIPKDFSNLSHYAGDGVNAAQTKAGTVIDVLKKTRKKAFAQADGKLADASDKVSGDFAKAAKNPNTDDPAPAPDRQMAAEMPSDGPGRQQG